MTEYETMAVRSGACPRCKRLPGQPCLTKSGWPTTSPHAGRTRPFLDAYFLGYSEGRVDAYQFWQQRPEGFEGAGQNWVTLHAERRAEDAS